MLKFLRTFIDCITICETGKIITNCKLYEISDSGRRLGRFYAGDNYSFMETEEEKIRIDYSKHFFTRSDYKIYNQYTGELIGHFDIPNGGIGRTTMKSTLYFTTGQKI
jgi:hypothetical protein